MNARAGGENAPIVRLPSPDDVQELGDGELRATGAFGRFLDALGLPEAVLVGLVVTWTVVFIRLPKLRHDRYGTFGFDLGIYDQGVWLLSRLENPFVTVRGLELFGHHANLFLILLAPFYRIGGGPVFLLVVQVLAQASGAIAIYLLARDVIGSRWAGTGLAAVLLLNPTYQWLTWEFFHPDAVAIGPLLFAYWAARTRRWRWFTVAAVLALLCKEDVALAVVMIGLLVAFRLTRHRRRAVLGVATIVAGALVPVQAGVAQRVAIAVTVLALGSAIVAWAGTDRTSAAVGTVVAAVGVLVPLQSVGWWKIIAGGIVVLAGLSLALDRCPEWTIGVRAAVIAGAVYILATRVLIPLSNGVGPFYDKFFGAQLGDTPIDMVRNISHHPSLAYGQLDESSRLTWYWKMWAPFALLPLFNLRAFSIALPMVAVNVLTAFPYTRDYRYHYSSLVIVGSAVATVEAVGWISRRTKHVVATRSALVASVVVVALVCTRAWGASPLSIDYHRGIWPLQPDPRVAVKREAIRRIPPDAALSAAYNLVPHLAHRERIYEFPVPWCNINWGVHGEHLDDPAKVQYLLIDRTLFDPERSKRDQALLDDLLHSEFEIEYEVANVLVARRVAPPAQPARANPPEGQCYPRPSLAAFQPQ